MEHSLKLRGEWARNWTNVSEINRNLVPDSRITISWPLEAVQL